MAKLRYSSCDGYAGVKRATLLRLTNRSWHYFIYLYSDINRKQCLTCLCLDSLVDSTVPMTPGTLPASMSPGTMPAGATRDITPAGATRDTTPAGATPATTPAGATPGTLPSVSVSMTPATLPPGQASSQSTSEYSSVPAPLPCRQCVL